MPPDNDLLSIICFVEIFRVPNVEPSWNTLQIVTLTGPSEGLEIISIR